ncbi:hypothetical protein GCM10027597_33330 [Saccharopolyspora tripterygii]
MSQPAPAIGECGARFNIWAGSMLDPYAAYKGTSHRVAIPRPKSGPDRSTNVGFLPRPEPGADRAGTTIACAALTITGGGEKREWRSPRSLVPGGTTRFARSLRGVP